LAVRRRGRFDSAAAQFQTPPVALLPTGAVRSCLAANRRPIARLVLIQQEDHCASPAAPVGRADDTNRWSRSVPPEAARVAKNRSGTVMPPPHIPRPVAVLAYPQTAA